MKPTFRTIEISDPRFERDGLRLVTVKSAALRQRADITIWIPDSLPDDPPLAILLHGVYGSHWSWTGQGGAHRVARRLLDNGEIPPMVLAMPSDGLWGDGSGYVSHPRQDFERWIVQEVPVAVGLALPGKKMREKFFLCGLSMGGFGALRIGAKYGDLCAGISAHSSITEVEQMSAFVEEEMHHYQMDGTQRDVLHTMIEHRATLPPLRFDCGIDDTLLEANRTLHAGLNEQNIAHVFEEYEGGHQWSYWEEHLADSLRFFGACLRNVAGVAS